MRAVLRLQVVVLVIILVLAFLPFLGCAGKDPVNITLATGLNEGFNAIRPDAELGLRVRSDPALAAAANVPAISAPAAAFGKETLDYHARLIEYLKGRAMGTIDPNQPLPPGPTANLLIPR